MAIDKIIPKKYRTLALNVGASIVLIVNSATAAFGDYMARLKTNLEAKGLVVEQNVKVPYTNPDLGSIEFDGYFGIDSWNNTNLKYADGIIDSTENAAERKYAEDLNAQTNEKTIFYFAVGDTNTMTVEEVADSIYKELTGATAIADNGDPNFTTIDPKFNINKDFNFSFYDPKGRTFTGRHNKGNTLEKSVSNCNVGSGTYYLLPEGADPKEVQKVIVK